MFANYAFKRQLIIFSMVIALASKLGLPATFFVSSEALKGNKARSLPNSLIPLFVSKWRPNFVVSKHYLSEVQPSTIAPIAHERKIRDVAK